MGICYSTSPSPTISNTKVTKTFSQAFINGGSFNVSISGTACVKYYARAYATVKGGTTYYGNELTFKHVGPLNDCHPFNGNWRNSANTITWSGNAYDFRFRSIASIPELNWRGALDANLISIGSVYVNNIVKTGERTWTCNVLWNKGSTSNNIITEVKYAKATLTLSSDEKQITISSTSPWPPVSSSSVTLTKL